MSAARIDHADRATQSVKAVRKTLEHVVPSGRGSLTNDERIRLAAVHAAEAQAEATLAFVEQQRIANLIALGQFRVGVNDLPHLRHLAVEPANEIDLQPVAEIREALGLS